MTHIYALKAEEVHVYPHTKEDRHKKEDRQVRRKDEKSWGNESDKQTKRESMHDESACDWNLAENKKHLI